MCRPKSNGMPQNVTIDGSASGGVFFFTISLVFDMVILQKKPREATYEKDGVKNSGKEAVRHGEE